METPFFKFRTSRRDKCAGRVLAFSLAVSLRGTNSSTVARLISISMTARGGRKVSHVAQCQSSNEVVCAGARSDSSFGILLTRHVPSAGGYRKFNNVRINNAGVAARDGGRERWSATSRFGRAIGLITRSGWSGRIN